MAKVIASLGALLLFCSFGAASAGGGVHRESLSASEAPAVDARVEADQEVAMAQALLGSMEPTPMEHGDMSDDEKERRRSVCDKQHENCRNKCDRYFPKKPKERDGCKNDCWEDYVACLKPIS